MQFHYKAVMACASGQPFDHGLPISERWLDNLSGIYPKAKLEWRSHRRRR
jgi:hypothetical protein